MNSGGRILYGATYKTIDSSTYVLLLNVPGFQFVEACGFVVYLTAQTLIERVLCVQEFLIQLKP